MIEDAIDPRPATGTFEQLLGAQALEALRRDPAALARNWNDRDCLWSNARNFRHWIERARDRRPVPSDASGQPATT